MWDLVSWLGIEPGAPTLELWSPRHWTTKRVPLMLFLSSALAISFFCSTRALCNWFKIFYIYHWGHSSLILHQNLTGGILCIKTHWFIFECIFFFTIHNFITSFNSPVENISSLNYVALLNVDSFHSITWNIVPLTSPRKPLHLKKLSSSQWSYSFSKILVFASLVVLIDHRHYQLISLKWQACFIHFWENVCQIPKFEYPWFDRYPFNQLKMVTHGKKAANSACSSITHVPFLEKCLVFSRSVFSSFLFWMWELDHKEGLALKNWCFRTVVLESTLESLLAYKEIKPVSTEISTEYSREGLMLSWSSKFLAS